MFTNPRSFFFAVLFFCGVYSLHAQVLPATDTVFFSNVKVGFSRDAALSITAASDVTILDIRIINRFAVPGEFNLITPTVVNFSMRSGERRNFLLRCIPKTGGVRTAALAIYTNKGDTLVELVADVGSTQPDVITKPDTLDFGVLAPNEVREIPYIIYGAGIDSVRIANLFITNDNGPSIYFEIYPTDAGVTFPHRMGPNDTLHMIARFTAYDPVGTKSGRGEVFGNVSGGVQCEFIGVVGKPEMQFTPQLLDLGIIPLGVTIDSFIHLRSIGEGAVTVESITPPTNFTISGIPQLPHNIRQNDSLFLGVHFTALAPGVYEEPLEAMAKSTASGGRYRSALLKAIVLPNQATLQAPAPLQVPCAIEALYTFTDLLLTDTGTAQLTISRITSNNPNVTVDPSFTSTILDPGQTISVGLDYQHRIGVKADSAIIEVYSGNYVILRDTVYVQTTEQFVKLNSHIADNNLIVSTVNNLDLYDIKSLQFELSVANPDLAALLINNLSAHPALANASMITIYDSLNSLYRVEFSATSGLDLFAGDVLFSIPIEYYYTKDSISEITAACILPEFASGCLTLEPGITSIEVPDNCMDDLLRNHLRGEKLITKASLSENPIYDRDAVLHLELSQPSTLAISVVDVTGTSILQDFKGSIVQGQNQYLLPVNLLPNGTYTAQVTVRSAQSVQSISIPFVIIR